MSVVKNHYCITIENAGKKTEGYGAKRAEDYNNPRIWP